jgi:two-component system, NarL family, sensor histidine kinase UhpB
MSLRFRLNLLITLIMLLFAGAGAYLLLDATRTQIREEMHAGTTVTVQLLSAVVRNTKLVADENSQQRILVDFLDKLGRVRANEIRFVASMGNQLYASPPSAYKIGRNAPVWFSKLVTPKIELVHLSLPVGELQIIPNASRATLDAWDDMKRIAWIFLGFFLLVNGVVFWFIGRGLAPVKPILRGLAQMQAGNFSARLPPFSLPEMSAISSTFNSMAETLATSTEENNRLALIVQQTSDAILIMDRHGVVIFSNPAATALFGSGKMLVGKSASINIPTEKKPEFDAMLESIFSNQPQAHGETQRITGEGKIIDVALATAPLIDPQTKQAVGAIFSLRDITASKAAERTARELDESRRFSQLMQQHTEAERASMARELHDELGQCATAIKTLGMSIANRSAERMPEIRNEAQTIVSVASQLYDMVHGMISQLRPPVLDQLGLADALQDAVFAWQKSHPGVEVKLQCAAAIDDLPEATNIAVFRIVQECLTNVARHAAATTVQITLTRNETGELHLMIKDNGVGSEKLSHFSGSRLGLRGMQERVQALHGTIEIDSRAGQGFTINVLLPLHSAESAIRKMS